MALATLPGPKDTIAAREPRPTARCRWDNGPDVDGLQLRALLPKDVQNQQLGRHGSNPAIGRDTDRCDAFSIRLLLVHGEAIMPNTNPAQSVLA